MNAFDYNSAWQRWDEMIRYSPAPFHRRRLLLQLAARFPWQTGLDVGCGNGVILDAMAHRFPAARLAGADIADEVIRANRTRFPSITFHVLDLARNALPERFDLVVCSEVLEHIEDSSAAIIRLRAMCAGRLLLTVPAGRVFEIDRRMGHRRHFRRAELESLLAAGGFRVETLWRWGFPFHALYKHLINCSPSAAIRGFASGHYSPLARWTGGVLTGLFYLNLRDSPWYHQLVVSAVAI